MGSRPLPARAIETPPPKASAGAERLSVITADGVGLSALCYGSPRAEVAVVFGHGFTGSQRNPRVVDLARRLAGHGLTFYTADFRGHGASGGVSTLGELEVDDVDAMVQVARECHWLVASVGASMGGFVALRHAGIGVEVDAVVSMSSPAVGSRPQLPRARFLRRAVRTERGRRLLDRYGTRVEQFVPVTSPALELADAHALYERLGEPRRLVSDSRLRPRRGGLSPQVRRTTR